MDRADFLPETARAMPNDRSSGSAQHSFFASRSDAGQRLGSVLDGRWQDDPAVVGITPGGVLVAAEVAQRLGAPLDVLASQRIDDPARPDLAIGAVTADAVCLRRDGELTAGEIAVVNQARHEVELFDRRVRAQSEPLDLHGRRVVLVDDGIMTGVTMAAAIRSLRGRGAAGILVAAPIASAEGMNRVLRSVTETLCLHVVQDLGAVADWYRSFPPVDQDAVLECLARTSASTSRPNQ